ncbi:hypothetical protein [Modestobacter italicus]|nr:hypothetical protein [Modestobacter marinus]
MTDPGDPVDGSSTDDGALGWPGDPREGSGLGWPGGSRPAA